MDKILVGLKRAVDYNVRVRVKSDGSGVETDGVKMSINPFRRRGHNKVAFVQYPVVSDSPLKDAIRTRRYRLHFPL